MKQITSYCCMKVYWLWLI